MSAKKSAIISLLLLLPIPSLGTYIAMILAPNQVWSQLFFAFCKFWVFALPLFWLIFIDKQKISLSKMKHGGLKLALLSGVIMSVLIIVIYLIWGDVLISKLQLQKIMNNIGLGNLTIYFCGMLYWILINSVLEEYVWRWFVFSKCKKIMSTKMAIFTTAVAFTIHHIFAMQLYFSWAVVGIATVGIFIGGVVWAWLYQRYQSIWPGYISHAIVDLTIFTIGYILIFM